jgi:hypothetical protein
MDELTKYNIARWRALVEADALFTRPALSLDPISAQHMSIPKGDLETLLLKMCCAWLVVVDSSQLL